MSAPPIPAKSSAFEDPDHWHPLEMFPFFRRWPCGPFGTWSTPSSGTASSRSCRQWACCSSRAGRPGQPDLDGDRGQRNRLRPAARDIPRSPAARRRPLGARARPSPRSTTRGSARCGVVVRFAIVALAFDPNSIGWRSCGRASNIRHERDPLDHHGGVVLRARPPHAMPRSARAPARRARGPAVANLRALQARHFLFNTLANVASLTPGPTTAKHHAGQLHPLPARVAHGHALREDHARRRGRAHHRVPAGVQYRMGARLRFRIEVAPELADFESPMLLQPVVENAIRHRLEPKVEGGELVVVRPQGRGDRDCGYGRGFQPTTRGGVGLSNLRDRLRLLYGERASRTSPPRAAAEAARMSTRASSPTTKPTSAAPAHAPGPPSSGPSSKLSASDGVEALRRIDGRGARGGVPRHSHAGAHGPGAGGAHRHEHARGLRDRLRPVRGRGLRSRCHRLCPQARIRRAPSPSASSG